MAPGDVLAFAIAVRDGLTVDADAVFTDDDGSTTVALPLERLIARQAQYECQGRPGTLKITLSNEFSWRALAHDHQIPPAPPFLPAPPPTHRPHPLTGLAGCASTAVTNKLVVLSTTITSKVEREHASEAERLNLERAAALRAAEEKAQRAEAAARQEEANGYIRCDDLISEAADCCPDAEISKTLRQLVLQLLPKVATTRLPHPSPLVVVCLYSCMCVCR